MVNMLGKMFLILMVFTNQNDSNLIIFDNIEDKQNWKDDFNGCNDQRSKLWKTVSLKCKGLSRKDIIEELGKPNVNDLESDTYFYRINSVCNDSIINKRLSLILFFTMDTVTYKGSRIYGG